LDSLGWLTDVSMVNSIVSKEMDVLWGSLGSLKGFAAFSAAVGFVGAIACRGVSYPKVARQDLSDCRGSDFRVEYMPT
jgi:hypothetical protein